MRLFSIVIFLFSSVLGFSQAWNIIEPDQNRDGEKTFIDFQKSFDQHWQGKNIDNGYYFENGIKQKAYGWKQFKRWEHHWESRVNESDGSFPNQRQFDEAYEEFRRSKSRSGAGNWINLGPTSSKGGYAGVGRINQVAFHPSDPNIYWATTPAGGLWATENDGEDWLPLSDMLDNLTCTAVAIPGDYDESQTIYLGTGEMDDWQHRSGIGLLKSTDGGSSWQETSLQFNRVDGYSVNKILIHPDNFDIMYAATSDGVFKSFDGGDEWEMLYNENFISDMEFLPGDPSVIVAANKQWGRIYRLSNNGNTQEVVYNEYNDGARRIELAPSISDPNIIYAIVVNTENGLRNIVKSTDAGMNYNTIFTPEYTADKPNLLGWSMDGSGDGGQGWYDLTFITDPNDANIIYCGGVSTWKSTNGGINWSLNSHWSGTGSTGIPTVHADKHYMAFNGNVLFECNDGGLYKSQDGEQWENISNGIINSQMYRLGLSQTEKYDIVSGLQDNGTKNFSNGEWKDVNGGDGMECLIDYTDVNIQYGESQYGNLKRTLNHWNNKKNIKPEDADGAWDTPFIIHPTNPEILYSGYQHVYKTENRGDDWEIILEKGSNARFRQLAISKSHPDVILACEPYDIWKTSDGGSNWDNINANLPGSLVTDIEIKHDDPNTFWVTMGGYNNNSVYQSIDGGLSWTDISTGIPPIPVNCIVQNHQKDEIVELYVGTDFGAYLKLGNANWQFYSFGMPKTIVDELEIYYDDIPAFSLLRAATYGRGMWETDLYSVEAPPIAEFSVDSDSINIGQTVNFTDETSNTPYVWNWEFEGGIPNTSSEINPSVIYKETGIFKVSLWVSNGTGENTMVKESFIHVECPKKLNYKSYKANSRIATYDDLGANGILINTPDNDNSNSDPIDIGFTFNYDCQEFDQFILNTNGFIKLGNTPPSDTLLHFDIENGNNQIFSNDDPQNDYIISPFNFDLLGNESLEFRVLTSGEENERICTIQFKGLKDKAIDGEGQYDNIEFQIKLHEANKHIEFVFGDWIESNNPSKTLTAVCGLKGSGIQEGDILLVSKNSVAPWTEVQFQNKQYDIASIDQHFGFNFGNPDERPKPIKGFTLDFTPVYFEDLAVVEIFALFESPAELASPEKIQILVNNNGYSDMVNVDIEINISDSPEYSSSTRVARIKGGSQQIVSFDNYLPAAYGANKIEVKLPIDDESSDNTALLNRNINTDKYNYASDQGADSGWGVEVNEEKLLLAKFNVNGHASIKSIEAFIFNDSENIGQSIYGLVLNEEGNLVVKSEEYILTEGDLGSWISLNLPDNKQFMFEAFYGGLEISKSKTDKGYYPLGVQKEALGRIESFYSADSLGQFPNEMSDNFGHRFMLGATVNSNLWTEGEASTDANNICQNSKARIKLSDKPAPIKWQSSSKGISGWSDVVDGFGSNLKTYLSEYLFEDIYYRARFSFGDTLTLYSNSVKITVNPTFENFETYSICKGESYIFPDGEEIASLTDTLEYISVLKSIQGCDSTIFTTIEVMPSPFYVIEDTICAGTAFTFPDGTFLMNIDSSFNYTSRFYWSEECDSIIETHLLVNKPDVSVTQNDTSLLATLENAAYQWLDCENDYAEIPGATERIFIPERSGIFAVSIDDGNCSFVSDCYDFSHVSTQNLSIYDIDIYPNPSDGIISLVLGEIELESIHLFDVNGKRTSLLNDIDKENKRIEIDLRTYVGGTYFLILQTDKGKFIKRIILN